MPPFIRIHFDRVDRWLLFLGYDDLLSYKCLPEVPLETRVKPLWADPNLCRFESHSATTILARVFSYISIQENRQQASSLQNFERRTFGTLTFIRNEFMDNNLDAQFARRVPSQLSLKAIGGKAICRSDRDSYKSGTFRHRKSDTLPFSCNRLINGLLWSSLELVIRKHRNQAR